MRSFQKNATFCVLLQKSVGFCAFFYVLCKRMLLSLLSFTFFAKECCILIHYQGKECIVLLGLKSQKTRKKNDARFKRMQKNDAFRT